MSASFDWDPAKDAENQRKHGVSFAYAQVAFLDPARVIARDARHSQTEQRFYCFGQVPEGVLTVRFTYRDQAPHHWRRLLASGKEALWNPLQSTQMNR